MVLLDTCALLWLASAQEHLSPVARGLLSEHADALFVSAISAFEIGVKARKGRLELPVPAAPYFARAVARHGLREIAIDSEIASLSTSLPPIHADPCDRFIIATAQQRHLTILTPDAHIRAYPDARVAW